MCCEVEFSSSVATRLPYSADLIGSKFNREGLELRLMAAIKIGLCARYFGLLLPLLLSILMILSSVLVNFPVNVKSFVCTAFDLGDVVHRAPFGAGTVSAVFVAIVFNDVDGNDVPMLFDKKCCCCCCC